MMTFPVRLTRAEGETSDSYLERVADANHLATSWLVHDARRDGQAFQEDPNPSPGFPSGWQVGAIEQACPRCLHETGAWLQSWRDPLVTCCTRHGLLLVDHCPGCSRPLRDVRHSPLRPTGYTTMCGNALGPGLSSRCNTNLADLGTERAPADLLAQQAHYQAHAKDPTVLATPTEPDHYRESLRSVAVLLLHLSDLEATRPARWSLQRPGRQVRAETLLEAHKVVASPTLEGAVQAFQPWFERIPVTTEGDTAWALDHAVPSAAITRLVMAAASTRQRLSHRLQHCDDLVASCLPQVLPHRLAHLVGGVGLSESTGRAFAPLCLSKAQLGPGGSWSGAGQVLGLGESSGPTLARTASGHMTCSTDTWLAILRDVAARLHQDGIDYHARTRAVRALSECPDLVLDILRETRPGTRDSSARFVLTWLAEEWAAMAPRRVRGDGKERALYRQFRASLTSTHQAALANCITDRVAERQPEKRAAAR